MLLIVLVFLPFLCGICSFLLGRKNEEMRDNFVIVATALELLLSLALPAGKACAIGGILSGSLSFCCDGFRKVYSIITALMWAGTTLFAKEYFRHERENLNRYWFFVMVTLGATQGVMLSADLMTTFVFFEILSFTSFTWVIHEETPEAVRAGYTYLFIAVIGGLILFMGLLLLEDAAGTLAFAQLGGFTPAPGQEGQVFAAGICILLGFGAKAGMFPLHVWLPKAHPVAPSPASALLSGVLTKVGVYGILMTALHALCGSEAYGLVILVLGVITMALGALLALFSVNLKRTLACSSMSQVGFILTGLGMAELLAAEGSAEGVGTALCGLMLHMVNHSLIKLVLFMAAGVVVMNLHTLTLDEIRGFGRNKPFLKAAFALGGLGIAGVPLFNGYISKTLLHEGIVEGIHECVAWHGMLRAVEWIFLASGGLTFAYMLKLFFCIFVEKNADPARQKRFDEQKSCMNRASTAVIFGSSLLMVLLGQPAVMTRLAAFMTEYEEILAFRAFTLENLKGSAISLSIGAIVYLLVVRHILLRNGSYVNLWPAALDLENRIYRPVLTKILPDLGGLIASIPGENKLLRHLLVLPRVGGGIASFFANNTVLAPLCRFLVLAGAFLGRLLETSLDAVIALLRATLIRERRVRGAKTGHPGLLRTIAMEVSEAAAPMTSNFTFALMMTCVGIIGILCAIIFISLF